MSKQKFFKSLAAEVARIDSAHSTKRQEKLISGFIKDKPTQTIIDGNKYTIFNSNDYLGLRHNRSLIEAEHEASERYGTGPGAVRFISGSFDIHRQLEKSLAKFHNREDAIVFSSAFAANLAAIFSLSKGQSKDSLVDNNTLVISDELNHRSIIDGIRLANLPSEQKLVFPHFDLAALEEILANNASRFTRSVIISDGVFSMLGEYQDLQKLQAIADMYDKEYEQGVLTIIDDCHGVAAFGKTGRGTEEVSLGTADVLVGTLGKGFGTDGGYVAANQEVIDYLRESAATYIYSNSVTPGTAAAANQAVNLLDSTEGQALLQKLESNVQLFKEEIKKIGIEMASDSIHPIQPILIGDTEKTKLLTKELFKRGYLVTAINYPVVPKGRDEIRVQINASHASEEISTFVGAVSESVKLI